jgi:hypothetical protein
MYIESDEVHQGLYGAYRQGDGVFAVWRNLCRSCAHTDEHLSASQTNVKRTKINQNYVYGKGESATACPETPVQLRRRKLVLKTYSAGAEYIAAACVTHTPKAGESCCPTRNIKVYETDDRIHAKQKVYQVELRLTCRDPRAVKTMIEKPRPPANWRPMNALTT